MSVSARRWDRPVRGEQAMCPGDRAPAALQDLQGMLPAVTLPESIKEESQIVPVIVILNLIEEIAR